MHAEQFWSYIFYYLPWTFTCAALLRPKEPWLASVKVEGRGALALGAVGGHRHRHRVTRQRGPGRARHAHYYRKKLIISPCDLSLWMEAPDWFSPGLTCCLSSSGPDSGSEITRPRISVSSYYQKKLVYCKYLKKTDRRGWLVGAGKGVLFIRSLYYFKYQFLSSIKTLLLLGTQTKCKACLCKALLRLFLIIRKKLEKIPKIGCF